MSEFIKKNLVLLSGIVLPVLLVAGFLILAHVPQAMIDPPKYDFLIAGYRYDHNRQQTYHLNFEAKDGKLRGRVTPTSGGNNNKYHAGLFRYNASEDAFEEIAYGLPDGLEELKKQTTFPIQEVEELTLNKKTKSPDGYTFDYLGYRGRGGILGEIFGMGRQHDSQYVLTKNGAYHDVPAPASRPHSYSQNLTFLGWVVPDGEAQ